MLRVDGLAGVDEAGCGSLIGDLVAAAVVVPPGVEIEGLNDSKKLTPARREALHAEIVGKCHVGRGVVTLEEINVQPFGWARRTVFQRALEDLARSTTPTSIVVDGNGFFEGFRGIPYELVVKADGKYEAVAAASIVAKVTRDADVAALAASHPELGERYKWASNHGYPTGPHLNALKEHGPSAFHRTSFRPCRPN